MHTLVWNPGLLRRWIPYGGRLLLGGKLPPRAREIAVLRVASQTRADYEWSQHVPIALEAGLSRQEIDALAGKGQVEWAPIDAAVIRAVDEMRADATISQATWDELQQAFEPAQLVELPQLVGAYTGLAYLMNSLGIELEPQFERLPRD